MVVDYPNYKILSVGMDQCRTGDVLVMCLVVLIPFVASMNTVEIPRFSRPVFVFPSIRRWLSERRFGVEEFLFIVLVQICFCVHTIVHLCGERICNSRGLGGGFWLLLLSGFSNESSSRNRTSLCDLEKNKDVSRVKGNQGLTRACNSALGSTTGNCRSS